MGSSTAPKKGPFRCSTTATLRATELLEATNGHLSLKQKYYRIWLLNQPR